ncbi:hypothetical protein vseg_018191 [Gypsophila vaccaria]
MANWSTGDAAVGGVAFHASTKIGLKFPAPNKNTIRSEQGPFKPSYCRGLSTVTASRENEYLKLGRERKLTEFEDDGPELQSAERSDSRFTAKLKESCIHVSDKQFVFRSITRFLSTSD